MKKSLICLKINIYFNFFFLYTKKKPDISFIFTRLLSLVTKMTIINTKRHQSINQVTKAATLAEVTGATRNVLCPAEPDLISPGPDQINSPYTLKHIFHTSGAVRVSATGCPVVAPTFLTAAGDLETITVLCLARLDH